jgi:hypothetical protein
MPAWRSGLLILPLLLTLCFAAQAQEVEVTSGLICDTQKQVEQFVALYRWQCARDRRKGQRCGKEPDGLRGLRDGLCSRARTCDGAGRRTRLSKSSRFWSSVSSPKKASRPLHLRASFRRIEVKEVSV